jgi:alkylglycerol monooxygenase
MSKVIVFATPVFLALMALEFLWGRAKARRGMGANTYRLNDTLNSISLGMMGQLGGILSKALTVGIYTAVFNSVALYPDTTFWSTWYGVLLALIFYDFCYYWLHRAGHEVALFWAAHVVHHQSQAYNLSTALRQSSSGSLFGWIFYLPMALAGVPPIIFGMVALIDLLYQFWVHTEHVGKLGWFDRVFCSPSNHRVHHAVNDGYLDKNYGGVLIVWDRLFGTFKEETVPCVYGTRKPLESWDPVWANLEVYGALLHDSWHAQRWSDKLRTWFKAPGWRATDVAARFPRPAFDIAAVQTFNPPMSRPLQWFAAMQFALLLVGVASFLWVADSLPLAQAAVGVAALWAGMWALGAAMQARLSVVAVLGVDAVILAASYGGLLLLR